MTYAKFAVVLLGTTALLPISGMAQTNNQNQATSPGAQSRAAQQANQQGLATSQLRNQVLYSQAGQEFGRVSNLVRDRQGRTFLIVQRGNDQFLAPAEQLRYENDRFVLTGITGNERLAAYNPQVAASYEALAPDYRVVIVGYDAAAAARMQQAEASRIVVQQRAPAIQLQQAAPQITVRQPEPTVTVGQPAPEILVQQPPPTIRVEMPQPQITVRMPQPDVDVAMAQPQVQVRQPQAQVQVAQPQGAPAVQVQREQPQVQIQRAQGEPQVQVQQAQPVVRYERMGEPRVIYNEAAGQPVVRVERIPQEAEAQAQTGSTTQAATQRRGMTEQERQRAQQRLIVEDVDVAVVNQAQVPTRPVAVSELDDMDVYNGRGERLGEIGEVVLDPRTNRSYVVVERGGFLGIGEDRVAFPLERFWMRGNQLVLRGVTPADIEAMDDYREQRQNYRRVAETNRVNLRLWN
ncbi:MAG: PRC-barrel domain-containing protein [Alphaproteobacteria bacterium]